MKVLASILAMATILGLAGSAAWADVITLSKPNSNTTIADAWFAGSSGFTNTNFGTGGAISVGASNLFKIAVSFSLGAIPAGQTITSATLSLESFQSHVAVTGYRLKVPWGETTVTWNKYDGATSWQVAGGTGSNDRVTPASFSVAAASITNQYLFTTADVTSDVQAWYAGSASNYGWLIESTDAGFTDYYPRESARVGPTLTITYVPAPEPASMGLLVIGGAMLGIRRRR